MKAHTTAQQEGDALLLFNLIKDEYSQKIDELNDLKKLVFSQNEKQLDQQLRSKLRITIESLLIDLNEEVFAISEELAKSFTFERHKSTLLSKAQEFEKRKKQLFKRIAEAVEKNPTVKTLRRGQKIQRMSPPQRDLNTFGPSENTIPTHESARKHHHYNTGRSFHQSESGSNHKR